jgi:hypothetical protein
MTCSDSVQNQGETGVDCGGPCKACKVATTTRVTTTVAKTTTTAPEATTTSTTLFESPAATGNVIMNPGSLSILPIFLLGLIAAYYMLKKRSARKDAVTQA